MESVLYITNATRTTLFTPEFPFKLDLFRCVTEGFLGTRKHTQSFQQLFSQCVREHVAPILGVCVFQTLTNELLMEFINNMASGLKMTRWREGGREGQRE